MVKDWKFAEATQARETRSEETGHQLLSHVVVIFSCLVYLNLSLDIFFSFCRCEASRQRPHFDIIARNILRLIGFDFNHCLVHNQSSYKNLKPTLY